MKISKVIKGAVLATFAVLVVAGGAFAADISECMGDGKKYEGINVQDAADDTYPVKCTRYKDPDDPTTYKTIYGKSYADCSQASSLVSDPDGCSGGDVNEMIQRIINLVIFIIGMVAVVMIILGGVNYATSQGDPGKVKKAKDTILYGIIGLVVAILAFALVNFIISGLQE